jgi:hypothetical protein
MLVQPRIFVRLAGDVTVRIELDERLNLTTVTAGPDAETDADVVLDAVLVERLASAVRHVRRMLGDERDVCPDHGLFDTSGRCPGCEEHEAAQRARKRLEEENGLHGIVAQLSQATKLSDAIQVCVDEGMTKAGALELLLSVQQQVTALARCGHDLPARFGRACAVMGVWEDEG